MEDTKIYKIEDVNAQEDEIKKAAEIVKQGGLCAFPTETVYGLGGNGLDPEAAAKIYAAKGRPSDNPLIIHIAEVADLTLYCREIPQEAWKLAEAFWPGPLTMILKKKENVPERTTGGLDTVAVRMPDHPVALALIRASGCPIAAPSANLSGKPSPTKAVHVYEDLRGRIPVILDGGDVTIGIESTIVDLTDGAPKILRPGYISRGDIARELQEEERAPGGERIDPAKVDPQAAPKAPGMKYRHYAPKAALYISGGTTEEMTEEILSRAAQAKNEGKKVGILCTEETKPRYMADVVLSVGSRAQERSIAHNLFAALRAFDDSDVDVIFAEALETPQLGEAVMNRLGKAAAAKKEEEKED